MRAKYLSLSKYRAHHFYFLSNARTEKAFDLNNSNRSFMFALESKGGCFAIICIKVAGVKIPALLA